MRMLSFKEGHRFTRLSGHTAARAAGRSITKRGS
jgi:hypothetical protein